VRNRIDTEFLFGSHKGELGVIIDASGTPFDQARLLVELLRQSGFSANYEYGDLTLSGSDFVAWTGLSQAKVACEFLAAGGIPASVNGNTSGDCELQGSVTSVVMKHVWVQASIGGQSVFMDPSFKPYTHQTTLPNLRQDIGFSSGGVASSARQGMQQGSASGQAYISNLNDPGVRGHLSDRAQALVERIRAEPSGGQRDLRGGDWQDLVGGRRPQAATRPSGGWRQSRPGNYGAPTTWTAIPDVFRAKLTVSSDRLFGTGRTTVFAPVVFFVDEIYGRRLEIGSQPMACSAQPDEGCSFQSYAPQLRLDGVPILTAGQPVPDMALLPIDLQLSVDHPFAAQSGAFADEVILKRAEFVLPMQIVHGWGAASSALADKWSREQGQDRLMFGTMQAGDLGGESMEEGDLLRARIGATWLAQFSQAREVHAELADSRQTHYHSIGLVSADVSWHRSTYQNPAGPGGNNTPPPDGVQVGEQSVVIDVETAFALTQRGGDPAKRRAALHAIAATGSTLEGSVLEQITGTPDAASTARRLAWGNRPVATETPDASSRRVFSYTSGDAAVVGQTLVAENLASGTHGTFTPAGGTAQEPLPDTMPGFMRARLASTVASYVAQGYQVVASGEAMLGPGHRHGAEVQDAILSAWDTEDGYDPETIYRRLPSLQVGGAIVATRYDGSGDPISIAHTLTRWGAISKGAGGEPGEQGQFDPSKGADALKDTLVDRSVALGVSLSACTAGYTSPTLVSVGQGDFPHRLDARVELRGAGRDQDPNEAPPYPVYGREGLVSNWEITASLGSSGSTALGEGRLEAMAETVVAFMAMQDLWTEAPSASRETIGALIANWWADRIVFNTATIANGASAKQFQRLADGSYVAQTGAGRVQVIGEPQAERAPRYFSGVPRTDIQQREDLTRNWNMSGVVIKSIGDGGDIQTFATVGALPEGPNIAIPSPNVRRQWNFRLAEWRFPSGTILTPQYANAVKGMTPVSVSSNLGVDLAIPTISGALCFTCMSVEDAAGGRHGISFADLRTRSATQRPTGSYPLAAIYSPRGGTIPVTTYAYDDVGRVKEARDAIAVASPTSRGAYEFFIAEGYRGERVDPLGGRFAVETLNEGRLTRQTDEEGRVSTATFDGRGRLLSRVSAWGDTTRFEYDARDNIIERTQTPLAGCGSDPWWCQTITVRAEYSPIWNKPTKVILPATEDGQTETTWTFTYTDGGLLEKIIAPATWDGVGQSNSQGVTQHWYDGFGRLVRTRDPTGIETTNAYGGSGSPDFCLTRTTASAQFLGRNLHTHFTCDAVGNVTSATDPRGNTTTTGYDALRRKIDEQGPSSTGIRTQWSYDLDGNVLEERRWDSTASAWRTTTTTYSLTGKPLTVTDPAGDVNRTCYDALDRAVVAVDPTGRAERTHYDGVGQPTLVEKWFTASVSDPACSLTSALEPGQTSHQWRRMTYNSGGLLAEEFDARDNRVAFHQYTGVGQRIVTYAADNTADVSLVNQRGQTAYRVRRDGSIARLFYDQAGRIYHQWEFATWTDPWESGRHVATAFDLAGRLNQKQVSANAGSEFDIGARDIQVHHYDNVGRVHQTITYPRGSMEWNALSLNYGYDDAGNRTSIQWSDGFTATYAHDAANRIASVAFGGHSASIAHDSLSRRTGVTRSSGASTSYGYEVDGDLAALGHGFVGASAQFTYTHDAAGRLTRYDVNRPDLEWQPSEAYARDYGAANALNQVSSAGGQGLSFDLNGNLTAHAGTSYSWTFGNRLSGVSRPGSTATYAYDGEDRRTTRISNGVMTRTLWSGADEVADYDASGTLLRRFIPDGTGAMDARLAVLEANGTIYWLHVDHQGSVIATSNAAGQALQFVNYSPYGEFGTDANGNALTAPPVGSPFGYTGRTWDPESGLWQYRARYYHPVLGQFLSVDPIGTKDDPNLYMYVRNDPVNLTDPTGECPSCAGAVIGGSLELAVQLTDRQTRQDYADAGRALMRGDFRGAWDSGGRHVTRVGIAAGAGAVGQVGATRVTQGAGFLARQATTVRGAERLAGYTTIGGNAAVGAATGAGSQAARNGLTGDNGSVVMAAAGGAGGGALGATVGIGARGSAQLQTDGTGRMVGTARGQVAAPGASQGRREVVAAAVGATAGRAYEEPFNRQSPR
jgi:RHS repeat-associated protein